MRLIRKALLSLALALLAPAAALAQSCNFNISDVNFGNVDTLLGAFDTTATLTVNCTGLGVALRICPSIGAGTGGANASVRQMTGPGVPKLDYQLYQDPARTVVWGSYTWGLPGTPPTIDLPLVLGSGDTTRTIYGRVFAGQGSVPPGVYSSMFTAAHTDFVYAILGVLPCPNLLLPQTSHPTFNVTANVENSCLVSAQNIDFGSHGVLSTNIDAAGELAVTCTPGTNYTVGLDGGLTGGAPTARKMAKGAEQITYGLFQNAGRTIAWGDTIGADTVAGSGSGTAQNLPVYGRVPPQTTPTAGVYTDTIVVTVTY